MTEAHVKFHRADNTVDEFTLDENNSGYKILPDYSPKGEHKVIQHAEGQEADVVIFRFGEKGVRKLIPEATINPDGKEVTLDLEGGSKITIDHRAPWQE